MEWKWSGLRPKQAAEAFALAIIVSVVGLTGAAADTHESTAAIAAETEDPFEEASNQAAIAVHNGDTAKAFEIWLGLAQQGHPDSQFAVGSLYGEGVVVEANPVTAADWWRKAAEQGHAGAQSGLGTLYSQGLGVPRDAAEAVRLWRRAAEQGHTVAIYNLAKSYKDGRGIPQDLRSAHTWFMTAVLKGIASYRGEADQIATSLSPEELAASVEAAKARVAGWAADAS